jgi:hypothetical protein
MSDFDEHSDLSDSRFYNDTEPFRPGLGVPGPRMVTAPAPCHWNTTAAAFADSGGLLTVEQLVEQIRQQVHAWSPFYEQRPELLVAHWIASQAVVGIESPWGRLLPSFQFDLPRGAVHACMRPLLKELQGVFQDAELALWFVTPNPWLDGARPERAMHHDPEAVRIAARSDRFVALGD